MHIYISIYIYLYIYIEQSKQQLDRKLIAEKMREILMRKGSLLATVKLKYEQVYIYVFLHMFVYTYVCMYIYVLFKHMFLVSAFFCMRENFMIKSVFLATVKLKYEQVYVYIRMSIHIYTLLKYININALNF
jgi:hypothetical protein